MRSNFRKTTITILLALCMAVSVFAVSAFAEDTNSTSTSANSTSVNHTCERKVVKYTATQAAKYIAGDNTYPEEEGYLFAGWYNNKACTKAGLISGGTPSGEEAYALYVPEHVLSIQAQASANLMDEKQTNDATGSLRFITSVDSLLYKQVGFEVYYVGADGVTRKATSASDKVYSKLYEMDSENVWEKTPSDTFCNLSKYFKICTLKNFTMQTYMETEFTVKPYWITMDGDKVYGVEATKKFSEGCLRDTVWVSNDGVNAPNYGDYGDPYATLDYAIDHVNDGGTVRVKDELTVATWGEETGHGKEITITGDGKNDDANETESLELETLTFTASDVCIYDAATFEKVNIVLSDTADDSNRIFAEGNHVRIAESVNLTNAATKLQVFGGGKSTVVKNTNLELYAGTYNGIYGGGLKDVSGNAKVTIGGSVNPNAAYSAHDDTTNMVFGGCYDATVHGNATVVVESGAKANYIYGGGDAANSNVLGATNVEFAGQAYCIYGGSRNGTNADTHVKINDGELYQVFGGCEWNSMVGDTDVQILGGKIRRRIYGGCYNEWSATWNGTQYVQGYTSVTISPNANILLDQETDNSFFATSRRESNNENELGVFIVNDYNNNTANSNLFGQNDMGSILNVNIMKSQSHHYRVNATSGGTVYSAGNCIYIVPDDENGAATVTIDGAEKHYTVGTSYYPLPSGHDASVPILVTFGNAKETISTDYKAKIGSAYYLTLEEAIAAADKMKDADIETINDSTQEVAKITVLDTKNGTVTSSCKNCVVGADSTVTLVVTPDDGYNCTGVNVTRDGTSVALDQDVTFAANTYTFTADTAGKYTVEVTFARKIFSEDGHTWNLSKQHTENTISLAADRSENGGWVPFYDKYVDMDLTLTIKETDNTSTSVPRTDVLFVFDDVNAKVSFGVTRNDAASSYMVQSMTSDSDTSYITRWYQHGTLTIDEISRYTGTEGVEFRIVRKGTNVSLYIDGRQVGTTFDITKDINSKTTRTESGITADMPAQVYIRHYNDFGNEVVTKFDVKDVVETIDINIADSEHGDVWANGENNTDFFMGDKITLVPKPEDGYECTSLKVDGEEVERATDGTYTFTATDITYDVEAIFQHKIFEDNTEWDLSKKREGIVSLPASRTGDSSELTFYGDYTDVDVTVTARDYIGVVDNKADVRTAIIFNFPDIGVARFSICYTDGTYCIQSVNGLYKWKMFGDALTTEEQNAYQSEDGIKFRAVRSGTDIFLYVNGKRVDEAIDLTSVSDSITAETPATVAIKQYGNIVDEVVEIPFSMTTDIPEKGQITVNNKTPDYGTFNVYRKYLVGDSLVLTAAGNDDYYYDSLTIDDKNVILDWDGTHTIETTKTSYEITGGFSTKTFIEHSQHTWNLTNQNVGILGIVNSNGDSGWMDAYTDVYRDVIVNVRDQAPADKNFRMTVHFLFTNDQKFRISLTNAASEEPGVYKINTMSQNTLSKNWDSPYYLEESEVAKLQSEKGMEFRVAIIGTTAQVYLDGINVCNINLSKVWENGAVTETDSGIGSLGAKVSLRLYGNKGYKVEVPYQLGGEPQEATFTESITGNGSVEKDKDSYIVGEKVTLTVAGDTGEATNYEDDYYYKSLVVNGEDITVNNDGTYTFIAQEENTIDAKFEKTIFKTNALTYWNLTNQHKGILIQRGGTTYPSSNYFGIDFAGTHTDSDVSVIVKENNSTSDTNQNNNRTTIGYWKSGQGSYGFSIVNNSGTYTVAYSGGGSNGWGKVPNGDLTEEEQKMITQGDGLEFRLVRTGALVKIYANGRYITESTLPFDTGQTLWIRQYDDAGAEVEIPYTMSASAPQTSDMSITTDGNGAVTTDKATNDAITDKTYVVREKVTLTATGKDGYYCNSLTVNGKEVQPNWDGTYTFTASEEDEVYATFAEGAFADNGSNWNLSRQNYGVLVPNYASGGNSDWINASGNYSEMTVGIKDYSGGTGSFSTVAKLTFENGKYAAFRILDEGSSGKYYLQSYGDNSGNEMSIFRWKHVTSLGTELSNKIKECGIDLRMVREGTTLYIYVDGSATPMLTLDLTSNDSGVTADTLVTAASIRHYGNPATTTGTDTTYEPEVPFSLVEIKPVALTLTKDDHGVVTTDADNYFVGDTVTATVSPDAGYVIDGLKVNGSEVALSKKGTYTFEATDDDYILEPVFARKIFVDSTNEWDVTNQYNGSITSNSDGDSPWLYTYDYYKDMDFAVTMKDQAPTDKNFRFGIQFTFENSKNFRISVTNDGSDTYCMQHMGDSIKPWKPVVTDITSLNSEFVDLLQGDGLEMRVVRTGLKMDVYLNDTLAYTYEDLSVNVDGNSTGITANMKAKVSIRHYGNSDLDIEMPFEIGESTDVVELHDTDLFYANNKYTEGTDPFVLDNTAVDSYYYMYSTQSKCYCYRSKDMMNWEYVGDALNYTSSTEFTNVVDSNVWAPEVVYDADTDLYYMFFSATPAADTTYTDNNASQVLFVATSKYPYKGFELVDFTGTHTYDADTYPHYYAKYLMLDPEKYSAFSDKDGLYLGAIDPHPYVEVDENGNETKYLFWVDSTGSDRICGVKMDNWLQPDWSTATVLTAHGYYTVADWKSGIEKNVDYELKDTNVTINEGPVITKHDGKYYLTFSVNDYKTVNYQVAQAVTAAGATSPLDAYTKLTEEEGGLLLSASTAGSTMVSGAGHHSFVTIGDQMYIVYHRHNDTALLGSARNHAIDEVKWVTNGNGLEVMYVNGPTSTAQAKIEKFSDYKNIASEAKGSTTGDLTCLTDGLVSIKGNADFMQYVSKLALTTDTTYTFEFDELRTVRAVMVYNSGDATFTNAKVEYVCEENGKEVTYTKNLAFDENAGNTEPGAAAFATLHGYNVKSVKVTVEVPDGETAGISEIKILGK